MQASTKTTTSASRSAAASSGVSWWTASPSTSGRLQPATVRATARPDGVVAAQLVAVADHQERVSLAPHLMQDRAVGADQPHDQRHLADGVRRAAQARVEGADAGLQRGSGPLGDLRPADVVLGDLRDGAVHRQVVLARGDDQVDLRQQAVLVDLVVVEQRAARRLADADAFQPVDAGVGPQLVAIACPGRPAAARSARSRPGSRSAGRSGRRTTTLHRPAAALAVLGQFRVGQRRAHARRRR